MNVRIISGSRADRGLLSWPANVLADAGMLNSWCSMAVRTFPDAVAQAESFLKESKDEILLVLGDRWEILAAATVAHLKRIPIAHLCGGDVSEGSYDDAMRDCISRMATVHFATSNEAYERLIGLGYTRVHLVGNPAVDYIRHANWRKPREIKEPYVVVAYYPETIDDTVDLAAVDEAIGGRQAIWVSSNPDRGAERLPQGHSFSHADFLNLIAHCEEFIGNSSSIFYEAPALGVKTKLIGKRQRGRVMPWGDGKASERIRDVLKAL